MIIPIEETYPESLPLPYIEYSGAPRNSTICTPAGAAFIARRSRFTKSYVSLSLKWFFTSDQYTTFRAFVLDNLGNGAASFVMSLRYPKNSALDDWIVKLIGPYEATSRDGLWEVAASIDLCGKVEMEDES